MSIFNDVLINITNISTSHTENFKDDLESALEAIDKFGADYLNERSKLKDGVSKKNALSTLQSIHEDEDYDNQKHRSTKKAQEADKIESNAKSTRSSTESLKETNNNVKKSNKRSKDDVGDISSPEQDKRPKRNASVRAQGVISKQVNEKLSTKLRRDESSGKGRRKGKKDGDSDKENDPVIVKQEKPSLPPEPMDCDTLPLDTLIKQEKDKDDIAMPPPMAPLPKPRNRGGKDKDTSEVNEDETTGRRRTTRTRKQTDTQPAARSTRASSRNTETTDTVLQETRPKRTRGRKKASTTEKETETSTQDESSQPASPAEKPRPKRTRKGKNNKKEDQPEPPKEPELIQPKQERLSIPEPKLSSPILQIEKKKNETFTKCSSKVNMNETHVISHVNDMDKTVVLPNGVYEHETNTPKNLNAINNDTVVIEKSRDTLDKMTNKVMDATVVLDKAIDNKEPNLTDDNSILTEDNSDQDFTPPKKNVPAQPTSAVKEKVQQFEELASRVTRTKTRAMAKKEDPEDTQTPPEKVSKVILSAETLTKMNSLIFNGKHHGQSSSASKPRANIPSTMKTMIPSSTSKLTAISKKDIVDDREDARKKKEALLEAKKEAQKRKREEKMAAAAAARNAAERERQLQVELAEKERREKQAVMDRGREERMKLVEKKKQEVARKALETEERRKAEEAARLQKLQDEQRKAEMMRKKQYEEQLATKKEAELMAKEIEKRQKEYMEKQKMMKKLEANKTSNPTPAKMQPVYMLDGFEQLNSDESDDECPKKKGPVPAWSTSKVRWAQLIVQSHVAQSHIDQLFSVRVHSVDLREIFPDIDRRALKRTSSAVWRTPTRITTIQE